MTVDKFLVLLEFYLNSTFIQFEDSHYVQKQGICIGSCVAPLLCNIFLSGFDKAVNEGLDRDQVVCVYRYVDDFLVLLKKRDTSNYDYAIADVLHLFQRHGKELSFTHELTKDHQIQFLDIALTFFDDHVCWKYNPRSQKSLLPYDSSHSKTVKRAIASQCVVSALKKSCIHSVQQSFAAQMVRLQEAGFPQYVLTAVAEAVLKKIKAENSDVPSQRTKVDRRCVVVPYVHKTSHHLKKVGKRHGVQVVFSAPKKLKGLCARIGDRQSRLQGCGKKHANSYAECNVGVVYEIPLSCGKSYVGQTGRCVNVRMREHELSFKNDTSGHLPTHCSECKCELMRKVLRY